MAEQGEAGLGSHRRDHARRGRRDRECGVEGRAVAIDQHQRGALAGGAEGRRKDIGVDLPGQAHGNGGERISVADHGRVGAAGQNQGPGFALHRIAVQRDGRAARGARVDAGCAC